MMDEPHIKWPLFIFCMLVAAVIILFYGTVVFGSFVQTWGYNYTPDPQPVCQGPGAGLGQPAELHGPGPHCRTAGRPFGYGHRLYHRQAQLLRQAVH